jgi:hypothetical protein
LIAPTTMLILLLAGHQHRLRTKFKIQLEFIRNSIFCSFSWGIDTMTMKPRKVQRLSLSFSAS